MGLAAILSAQTPKLEFEVASVRTVGPVERGVPQGLVSGGPGSDDPGRITYAHSTMQQLIVAAYGVGRDQISGPDWVSEQGLTAARYDISAKVPAGTTKAQLAQMLQNLLTERFQLTLHRVAKEFSGYALVVAKGGSKLKESAGPITDAEKTKPGAGGLVSTGLLKDGFPPLFPGMHMGGAPPLADGMVRLRFRDYPLSDLAQQLSAAVGTRVADKTGMKGNYDFTLMFEIPQDAFMVGVGATLPLQPGQMWIGSATPPSPGQMDAVPAISSAMEKQLGLKLEAAKIPMDVLVIDRIEKTPVEN